MCGDLIIIKIACCRHFLEFSKIFIFSIFGIFFKRLLCARALKEFTSRNAFPLLVFKLNVSGDSGKISWKYRINESTNYAQRSSKFTQKIIKKPGTRKFWTSNNHHDTRSTSGDVFTFLTWQWQLLGTFVRQLQNHWPRVHNSILRSCQVKWTSKQI